MMLKTIFTILFTGLILSACTDRDATYSALTQAGYKNIQISGYSIGACSQDDFSATKFKALSPSGTYASGVVCCGLIFKNCTIRYN